MFEARFGKYMIREMEVKKVAAHVCLPIIVKELKISIGEGRVITTLNIVKH